MISGTVSDAPREVLKYGIERLDYVDMNPLTVETARLHTQALNDPRVRVVNEDVRIFLRSVPALYDAVLLNVGEPSTVQLNRFYTAEFFESLKARMNPHAVLSLGMFSATDYQSDDTRRMNSTMVNTLRSFFRYVLIVPGQRTYMLASDSALDLRIGRMVRQSGVATEFVNEYYIDDQDMERRSRIIEGTLDPGIDVNRDFSPVAYYVQMVHWLSYFRSNIWVLGAIAVVLVALTLRHVNSVSLGLLSGGFAASCIEVLILIAFQTLCGYVYQMLGIIVTVFMGGLAFGALARRRIVKTASFRSYSLTQFGIALYSLLLALVFLLAAGSRAPSTFALVVFPLLTFVIAVLVGFEFSIAASLRQGEISAVASELYAVDSIGSAVGALLVTTVLIPSAGLIGVCFIVAVLSLATSLVALMKSTKPSVSG
jgi:spermidine synthase